MKEIIQIFEPYFTAFWKRFCILIAYASNIINSWIFIVKEGEQKL